MWKPPPAAITALLIPLTFTGEALEIVMTTSGMAELAQRLDAIPAYRRVGSVATARPLSVGRNSNPAVVQPHWPPESHLEGWVEKWCGVSWPDPA